MPQLKDLIIKTEKVNWQELKDLQPNNLKTPYHTENLKKSLVKNGFAFSFYIWEDKNGDKYLVDGHLRSDVLIELKNEGFDIPDELSCTFLDLPNRKTAIKYLLEVFNQKTNPINKESLEDWFVLEEIEDSEVEVDWVDTLKTVSDEDYSLLDEVDNNQIESMANEVKKAIQIEFTPEDYDRAYELCQYARSKKVYIGEHLIGLLEKIKDEYGD